MTQTPAPEQSQVARLYGLQNRYLIEGRLEMMTGLHIGGGKATLSYSNSPVVLTPDGLPYIPGSSFKGSLRSTIEKMVAGLPPELGLHSCGLREDVEGERCSTARHQQIFAQRSKEAVEAARQSLCHTCQLFGSPFAAARITVNDLALLDEAWSSTTQVRDGVAIDRDTETARAGLKYDFEVVPATTAFKLRLILENATTRDLQLLCIGLSEFISGFGSIGGFRSRGLGSCELRKLTIHVLDLAQGDENARRQRLSAYLLRDRKTPESGLEPLDPEKFLKDFLNSLFPGESASVGEE
jgi:CRISPR-associated RAMP protein (TIGR02581 family)